MYHRYTAFSATHSSILLSSARDDEPREATTLESFRFLCSTPRHEMKQYPDDLGQSQSVTGIQS